MAREMLIRSGRVDRDATQDIVEQRAVHAAALEDVRTMKEHAHRIRNEADEVINEARRAERILEGPRKQ